MKSFKCLFVMITKRFIRKRKILLFLLLLLSLYTVQKGFNNFKNALSESKDFQVAEQASILTVYNYVYYAQMGHNIFFMPAPTAIFFSTPTIMAQLSAKINTTGVLNINNEVKNNSDILGNGFSHHRFSDITYYLGCLLSILFGFESVRHKEYIKSIARSHSPIYTLVAIIASHAIILILSFITLFFLMILFVLSKGGGNSSDKYLRLFPTHYFINNNASVFFYVRRIVRLYRP